MKQGGLFSFLFVLVFVIVLAVFILGMFFMLNSALAVAQESLDLSPLQDEILIEDTRECSDSDNGIFFDEKGEVSFNRKFLFFSFTAKLEDKCESNVLIEYYCASEFGVVNGKVECEHGCGEGACIR